jgi:hypothetical protein
MGYDGGGVNGALRWRDLAMKHLLPVEEEKEEAKRATEARKMGSPGASNATPPQAGMGQDQTVEEDDEEENDENENEDEDEDSEETEGEEEEEGQIHKF